MTLASEPLCVQRLVQSCSATPVHNQSGLYTAKLLGVSTPTIQAWIEQFAQAYAQKPEPEGRAVVIELDEMWHYLKKVEPALDLEGLGSCYRAAGGLGMRRS
jgi:hypothetical protein